MNSKGQSLILFVLLIPLLIMAFALIFDSAQIIMENNRLKNIAEMAIDYGLEDNKNYEDIYKFIKKNDSDIEIIKLEVNDKVKIELKKYVPGTFGQIIGYDKYELRTSYEGYFENNKIIYKEVG